MQRTATVTIATPDDTQDRAVLDINYTFDPPLTADHSALANVVGYLLRAINQVAVSGQVQ